MALYDERDAAFYDVREPGSRKIRVRTPTIFLPLADRNLDAKIAGRLVEAHLHAPREFATPFPLPSVAVRDPSFRSAETAFLWRGPLWAFVNWFTYHGLKKHGFSDDAGRLRRSLRRAIERSGFREYYHPFTGEGHGARDFSWAGLVLDMT